VLNRVVAILKNEGIAVPDTEKPKLVELVRSGYPDMRRIINDIQKFSFTGTLIIKDNRAKGIANKVVEKIRAKVSPHELRKYVIEREQEFSGDYLQLLKEMFEVMFETDSDANNLLIISEGMYKDAIVIDKEINWFSTCLRLCS
jgi:DNA polymerase III delta prime subunit